MSNSISINSRFVANASIPDAHLRRTLGSFELVFLIEVSPTPLREQAWWVRPQSVRVRVLGAPDHDLGTARPDRLEAVHQNVGAYSKQVWMTLPLHPHQLSALETGRDGRDLSFGMTVFGDGGDEGNIREAFQADIRLTVPRSKWIEQLRSVGAMDILLLEVPMPFGGASSAQAEAAKQLQQAQSRFAAGNYNDAIGACRLALEELGVNAAPLAFFGAAGKGPMTKSERGQAMLAAVRHYTHPPHHTGAEKYSRDEARLVLQITAAAIAAGPL